MALPSLVSKPAGSKSRNRTDWEPDKREPGTDEWPVPDSHSGYAERYPGSEPESGRAAQR